MFYFWYYKHHMEILSMKRFLAIFFICIFACQISFAHDKYSKEYLQSHRHAAFVNPFAEKAVEYAITRAIKKDTGAKFKVKFTAYTLSSMKQGIFKHLELKGKRIKIENIPIPSLHIVSLTDYNWVDYNCTPIKLRSDMTFNYEMILNEDSMNAAFTHPEYQKNINRINKIGYPFFRIYNIVSEIKDNRLHLTIEYNIPIASYTENKKLHVSSGLHVNSGKISMTNTPSEKNMSKNVFRKMISLINYVNPLEYTIDVINKNDAKIYIENVNIIDDKIKINGKIFVKGDS